MNTDSTHAETPAERSRPLRAWVVCVGEPLPIDGADARLFRAGLVATVLRERGHDVTWWTSSFYHAKREHRVGHDTELDWEGLHLRLLRGVGYRKTVSVSRFVDHRILGRKFRAASRREPRPDVVFVCLPTLELAREAVDYGKEFGVPVVVDIRDQWPEIFLELVPERLHSVARLGLAPLYRDLRRACRGATAISGITERFVEWGVSFAGRKSRASDQAFPLAYWPDAPSSAACDSAREFWNSVGHRADEDHFVAVFFGAMNRHCRLDTVIEAAKILEREGGRKFRFLLAGSGQRLAGYESQARGCESVVLPGWIDRPAIWEAMRDADVGLIPYEPTQTFLDSIPNKVAEYTSAGLPIVSTLGEGLLGELVRDRDVGSSYAVGDAEGLAKTLRNLAEDSSRLATMSDNAAGLFEERFDARVVYGRLADSLEALARGDAPADEEAA